MISLLLSNRFCLTSFHPSGMATSGDPSDDMAKPGDPPDRMVRLDNPPDDMAKPGDPPDQTVKPDYPLDNMAKPGDPPNDISSRKSLGGIQFSESCSILDSKEGKSIHCN